MKFSSYRSILFALLCTSLVALSCKDSNSDDDSTYNQVDRIGRPAIGTVFIHQDGNPTIDPAIDNTKNMFNTGRPDTDQAMWRSTFVGSLTAFRGLYGGPTNDIAGFADLLLPDVLTMNLSRNGGTSSYLGDVLTNTSDGGRALADDVIDASLAVVLFPGDPTALAAFQSDAVNANDKAFLTSFPYLATPN